MEEILDLVFAEPYLSDAIFNTLYLGLPAKFEAAGLSLSSIKVHLAAISAFHPGEAGCLAFANPVVLCFLKGLDMLYPQDRQPTLAWDLNLVPPRQMGPPFKALATCSLLYRSWKVAFLVAITSARRVSELKALTSDPPYTIFYKDKVQL